MASLGNHPWIEEEQEPLLAAEDEDKDKKPFVDKVLQRAVEHLKKEMDKVGPAPVAGKDA